MTGTSGLLLAADLALTPPSWALRSVRQSPRAQAAVLLALGALAALLLWQIDVAWTNLGFGTFIIVPGVSLLFVIARLLPGQTLRQWRHAAAIGALGALAWGILGLIETSSGPLQGASLGGHFGQRIAGGPGALGGLRLAGCGLLAVVLFAPRPILIAGRQASRHGSKATLLALKGVRQSPRAQAAVLLALGALAALLLWQIDVTWTKLGFGTFIIVPGVSLLFVIARLLPGQTLRQWRHAAAIGALGALAWGILGLIETSSGQLQGASLGGHFGQRIAGGPGALGGLRLAGCGLLAVVLFAPRPILIAGRQASRHGSKATLLALKRLRMSGIGLSRLGWRVLVLGRDRAAGLVPHAGRGVQQVPTSTLRSVDRGAQGLFPPLSSLRAPTDTEEAVPPFIGSLPMENGPSRVPLGSARRVIPPGPPTVSSLEDRKAYSGAPAEIPTATEKDRAVPQHSVAELGQDMAYLDDRMAVEDLAVDGAPPVQPFESIEPQQGLDAPAEGPRSRAGLNGWRLPPLEVLDMEPAGAPTRVDNDGKARAIEEALRSYNIDASVVEINPGPAVTQFGIEPGWVRRHREVKLRDADNKPLFDERGNPMVRREEVSRSRVKVDAIANLDKDLSMALAAPSIRIEAPIPGKSMVGVEVPNMHFETVALRTGLQSQEFRKLEEKSRLAIVLGKGSGGQIEVADLAQMPHLLIAGATGSGKSIGLRSILVALLMNATPEEVRLLLIDPKRVELVAFNSIPHLVGPVIQDVERVVDVLRWAISEMEERYKRFSAVGARNLEGYNKNRQVVEPLPFLVIVIDELADLMMAAPYDVEHSITRLAQLGRATGIHLIVATQRPSVDVVTGLIKANFPTRISFAVSSLPDSRTILDTGGAEKLLGRGDMLYLPQDAPKPKRVQGVFVSDAEVERVVRAWNAQRSGPGPTRLPDRLLGAEKQAPASPEPERGPKDSGPVLVTGGGAASSEAADDASTRVESSAAERLVGGPKPSRTPSKREKGSPPAALTEGKDPFLPKARQLAERHSRLSTSLLQRELKVGYNKAVKLVEALREEGLLDQSEAPTTSQAT